MLTKEFQNSAINTMSLECMCKDWLHSKKLNVKESTYCRYHNILHNHIIPFILTSELSSKEIQDYLYLLLKQGYSEKTVRDIWGIMKNFMRFSTSNGIDLGIDVSQISIKKRKSEVHYLEIEEQKKLCSYLVEHIT